MTKGNQPTDGGNLLMDRGELDRLLSSESSARKFVRRFYGSSEFIKGEDRYCLWVTDELADEAASISAIQHRFASVKTMRQASSKIATRVLSESPHRFGEIRQRDDETVLIVPSVSSESRAFLPAGFLEQGAIVSNLAFAIFDAPVWALAIVTSRLHLSWIAAVCGKLETRYRYSNTLGWNTFPVPNLTSTNKADLTRCAENILLAREHHFPATIADLYAPEQMPADLQEAHEQNDETLERIYIGRRFRNDSERLEKLFAMYAEMTAPKAKGQ